MKKIKKRLLPLFMAVIMLLGLVPTTAFAADVTMDLSKAEVSWDYTLTDEDGNSFSAAYGIYAKDNPYGYSVSPRLRKMHDYTAKRPGLGSDKSKWVYGQDYVYCFCIEHGIPLPDSESYAGSSNATHGNKYEKLSAAQKDLLALALTYGYPNRPGLASSKEANACYSATQLIVWQITLGFRTSATELNDKSYPMAGYTGTMTEQYCKNPYFKDFYDRILTDMADHYKRPSFTSTLQSAAPTYELKFESGKYTTTLTDTNNMLQKFYVSVSNGVSVSISGNTLTLSSSKPITDEVIIKLNRRIPSTNHTTGFLIWSVPGKEEENQDMVSGVPANNDPVPAYLRVKAPAGHIKLVKTSEDGKVGNVPFHISGSGIDKDIRTQSDGTLLLENLQPGVYEITEQTENKYEPQATKRVTVVSGQTATVTFNNTLKRGNLSVTKTAEDGFVEDKTFHLYGTSLSGLKVDEYAVTDSRGIATFRDVLISGNKPYTLEEVGVEDKYVVPKAQQATIEWNKVTQKSFDNVLKKWRATLTKSDSETGTAQGDASLENAEYGVFKGNQLVKSYFTGPNGDFVTDWYPCGDDWSIKELAPSSGYLLNPKVYPVGAEPKQYELEYNELVVDVDEDILKGRVAIIKHSDDGSTGIENPEKNAEFQIFLRAAGSYENAVETERDILLCDEYGFAESKSLPFGWYRVHQTKAGVPGTEFVKDFDVFISKDGAVYRYLLNNAQFESRVMVVKKDAETGNTVPLAGHGYNLYDPEGNKISMTLTYPEVVEIDTFYTDSNGYLITPESLPYGKGYSLVEVETVEPYVLDSTPVHFNIIPEDAGEHDGVTVIVVEKANMPQKGTISLYKDGEVFSSVTTTGGGDAPRLYQPVYAKAGLAGGVYDVVATTDVFSGGVLRYTAGETVATLTTGPDGWATSKPLYLSTYQIFERKAPYGMTLNPEPITVTLSYAGQNVEITTAETHITNERQYVQIELSKVLEQDERFGIGMNGELLSVKFALYAAEDLIAADGTKIPKDGLIEIVSCDENGKAAFLTDLPVGAALYVREYSTDEHYQMISDKAYPVLFEYTGQDIETVFISANNGEDIENKLIRGDIYGMKVNEDGDSVAESVFGLFRPDETEFNEENALMTAISNEAGEFAFLGIPYGDWVIKELSCLPQYILSDELFRVTVSEPAQRIEIKAVNKWVTGSVQTTKVDADYPENKLSNALFGVYLDVNDNKVFDEGIDTFMDHMQEIEPGVYQLDGLKYNGYFLYEERSPEHFIKDDHYHYFEIRENGQMVIVENKAGVGFINNHMLGNLKIAKTSSDGRVEGFSFRVTGENYDEVFKTDANGEIFIEGLRIGKFTVTELEDEISADYRRPDPVEVELVANEMLTVNVRNDKITVEEPPKTGDNSNMALWFGLLSLSCLGMIGTVVCGNRKKAKIGRYKR